MKKLIPLLDRVLVLRAEALTKTAGGIVIPEKAQEKVQRGTVVAVGPGQRNQVSLDSCYRNLDFQVGFLSQAGQNIPINVKVGDQVLLPSFGGTKVELEDQKEYLLFKEADILAKVE